MSANDAADLRRKALRAGLGREWRAAMRSAARMSDRELDRCLADAALHLIEETSSLAAAVRIARLAAAVRIARWRLFPLHCCGCGDLPHPGHNCHKRRRP